MTIRAGLLPLALGLAACSGSDALPDELDDCTDADCRVAWVMERWPAEPGAVRALTDPTERVAAVIRLTEAHPGQTEALCQELPRGPDRQRCSQLNRRPHLYTERAPAQPSTRRPGGGPDGPSRLPPTPWPSAFADQAPSAAQCTEPSPSSCFSHRATQAVLRRQPAEAVAACHAIPEARWQQECVFMAAQQLIRRHGAPAYRQGVDLCALAGEFVSDCLAHLSNTLRPQSPPALHDWRSAEALAETIEQTWAAHDPAFGALLAEHYRAAEIWRRYGEEQVILGAPEDLPPAFAPHLRTVAALNLLRAEQRAQPRALSALNTALQATLSAPPRVLPRNQQQYPVELGTDRWPSDSAGEENTPALVYPGGSRRPTSADPEIDGVLAIVEAAARTTPTRTDVLEQARDDPRAIVSWSARRLLAP